MARVLEILFFGATSFAAARMTEQPVAIKKKTAIRII
jgi:hypothetical protein